ncbi:MAG: hypothetical protein PHP45_09690 [Elusimicrobiales bacterium]|nr:hypothetical protein [Elusimicrobiales bacterium]
MNYFELLAVIVILCDVALCAASRLRAMIRAAAVQGAALGLLAFIKPVTWEIVLLSAATIAIKAVLFPWLLNIAREKSKADEPAPYVGYNFSFAICAAMFGVSVWLSHRLDVATTLMAGAFFTVLAGFFVIVSRKSAFSQAIGYLVLEGGVYAFGMAMPNEAPALVELGLLLDVFMAVFIMGIMVYHISREFEHADMAKIAFLSDLEDYD